MNYSEVKKELKKEFESFLKPLGFKSKVIHQGCDFERTNNDYKARIGYGIANYIDTFYTGCFIGIHNKPIDLIQTIILNEVTGQAIGTNIGNCFNELNYRYKIQTLEDIKEWGKIVRKFYEEYAVPFFEKYNTVDSVDKLLNENPSQKVIYLDDLGWRIIKGLIAAKLNNNPKYNQLRDYYRSEVESKFQGYFMYEKCIKTIDFLENHNQEELSKIAEG